MNQAELINLRNLSLGLHANAGLMVTIPTNGAIAGSADATQVKAQMTAYLNLILVQAKNISLALGMAQADVVAEFTQALNS